MFFAVLRTHCLSTGGVILLDMCAGSKGIKKMRPATRASASLRPCQNPVSAQAVDEVLTHAATCGSDQIKKSQCDRCRNGHGRAEYALPRTDLCELIGQFAGYLPVRASLRVKSLLHPRCFVAAHERIANQLGKDERVPQAKVQALAGNRVQGLRRIADTHAFVWHRRGRHAAQRNGMAFGGKTQWPGEFLADVTGQGFHEL